MAPTAELGFREYKGAYKGRWGRVKPNLAYHLTRLVEFILNFKCICSGAFFIFTLIEYQDYKHLEINKI